MCAGIIATSVYSYVNANCYRIYILKDDPNPSLI